MRTAEILTLSPSTAPKNFRTRNTLVAIAAITAAFSGIAYELVLASYATFLFGSTLIKYSLILSSMMLCMGCGALLSERFSRNSVATFITLEISLAWIASIAAPLMYFAFFMKLPAWLVYGPISAFIGFALGMEIPLLGYIRPGITGLSWILAFDYLGGFFGGLLFPLFLFPKLGFFRLAGFLGLLNSLIALGFIWTFRKNLRSVFTWYFLATTGFIATLGMTLFGLELQNVLQTLLFQIRK